jgi:pentatricopeptide repeat protein
MTSLMLGRLIHFYIVECSSEYKNVLVGNMLINMYARCESLDDAVVVFMSLQNPNEFSWGALIVGCAQCGRYDLSLKYLDGMQAKGFILSEPLFVCLLSACCHAGMVDEAFQHLNSMEEKYGITPTIDHFYCIMDLLARTGCLTEAEDILQTVPFGTDSMGWSTVLSHCNTYGNVGIGSRSFDNLALLDHRHASGYVLMSNIYVNASMWEEVEKVQGLRASAHAWKKPGRAVIEIRSQVYEFCVADDSKFHNIDIHSLLKRLSIRLKENAYMPGIDFIMHLPVMQRKMPSLFNEE